MCLLYFPLQKGDALRTAHMLTFYAYQRSHFKEARIQYLASLQNFPFCWPVEKQVLNNQSIISDSFVHPLHHNT